MITLIVLIICATGMGFPLSQASLDTNCIIWAISVASDLNIITRIFSK
jgi:hypothetical protein